ncbi:hypothetical protein O9X81_10625 [Agrobacterium salinitolerans]|uniref:hypothetical protein n=1 Tax=Agrobacterium salinitolerans TaxID=1183413 RepID=UPI0022B84A8C|nr:hypothetical protein [Agrobacterium salinitolerans]MCZ7857072.1 hypothetical protein [Agrobacterium salinitolerans]
MNLNYQNAITASLDAHAQSRGYTDAADAISYANSEEPTFEWEARSIIRHRDEARKALLKTLVDIEAGGTAPTVGAFIASLPELKWL